MLRIQLFTTPPPIHLVHRVYVLKARTCQLRLDVRLPGRVNLCEYEVLVRGDAHRNTVSFNNLKGGRSKCNIDNSMKKTVLTTF